MAELTEEVTFRISAEELAALKQAAKDAEVPSTNLMARRLVRDALKGETSRQEMLLRLQQLEALVQKTRGDVATSTHVLLMAAHHPDTSATAADVAAWIAKNLRSP